MDQIFESLLRRHIGDNKFAVAVSGGADSMALALMSKEFSKKYGNDFVAITIDHGLRLESHDEAVMVGKWLKNRDIKHQLIIWQGDKPETSIQESARKARYSLFKEYMTENKIEYLLVAHHAEDQAETFLMRLFRGSSIDGLASISEHKEIFGVKVIRPFLKITKDKLKDYLLKQNQQWIEDPSNKNEKYERVRVRKFLDSFSDKTELIDRISTTISSLQSAKEYIEKNIEIDYRKVVIKENTSELRLIVSEFNKLHPESAYRILHKIFETLSDREYRTRFSKLDRLYKMIINETLPSRYQLNFCDITKAKGNKGDLLIKGNKNNF